MKRVLEIIALRFTVTSTPTKSGSMILRQDIQISQQTFSIHLLDCDGWSQYRCLVIRRFDWQYFI